MKNNVKMLALSLMWVSVVLAWCNNANPEVEVDVNVNPEAEVEVNENVNEEVVYDADSWKEIIPADCIYFFDGCNNCSRVEWEEDIVACTKMFCEKYEAPRCTDDEIDEQISDEEWSEENWEVLDGTENDTIMLDVE